MQGGGGKIFELGRGTNMKAETRQGRREGMPVDLLENAAGSIAAHLPTYVQRPTSR